MSTTEGPADIPATSVERRLAAILSADVKGYSRLMGEDEVATVRTLTDYRELMTTQTHRHRGRVVDSPGDNVLAEFASVVDAVKCAVDIQQEFKARNAELPAHRKMEFRIGINLGDVIVEGERIYGDGVNIAARLESLADPGGICISGTVYDQIENKLPVQYEYLGEQTVKNIAKPVRAWRVVMDGATADAGHKISSARAGEQHREEARSSKLRRVRPARVLVAGLLLAAGTFIAIRYLSRPQVSPQSSAPVAQEVATLPLPDKPSIVVLPFVNLSKDPDQEYFSDGLTEVLTGDLSRISSLFVIARDSAFTYKGKAVKVQDVGREMGVRYVLEGSVLKVDDQVRITAQLIDATTGYHLWSERYDRPLHNILTLQDEIVRKIVTTLKLQLALEEIGDIVRKHTDNLEAYDAYLRGVAYSLRFTQEGNAQARQMFEKAFTLDPQYAEACARLSLTYMMDWVFRWSADFQTLERASALAKQAVALDDSLPWAHVSLSWVYSYQQQHEQAIAEGERAIALDPNNAASYAFDAQMLNLAGRPEEAVRAVKQAMRLNPRYPPWYLFELGHAYQMTGRYAEAITTLKESIRRNPNFTYAHSALAVSYLWQWIAQQSPSDQTLDEALAAAQRAMALNDSLHWNHTTVSSVYLNQKQYEQALAEMKRGVALAPSEAWTHALLAEVLSRIGNVEDALEAAAQALRLNPETPDAHLFSVGAAYAVAGRYEEARAPLERYLSRYPNFLPAHVTLATVYSELGKNAEARAEAAEVLRLNPKFSLEVERQRTPIKDPTVLERHIAALRKAGLK
jgi:adenylate cyclase